MSKFQLQVTLPSGDTLRLGLDDAQDALAVHDALKEAGLPVLATQTTYEKMAW